MRGINKLSAAKVAKEKKPGRYGDGGGLWLQVSAFGTKAWIFRFEQDGRERQMGLGPLADVTLASARDMAAQARAKLREGIDPIDERNERKAANKAARLKGITFDECSTRFLAAHEETWKNEKHRAQWKATLATYVSPVFGELPVGAVDVGLVLKAVEPIWRLKPETASRVRGRIETILDWATARGYRHGDNPARWRGHLDKLLPARSRVAKVKHRPALPYAQLPSFMSRLRGMKSVSARALEFTILTAARTGEVIGAQPDEIGLDRKVWTVPPERMKAKREHRVPLCDRAVEIVATMPTDGYVFPGGRAGRPLSNMAMLELLRGIDPTLTVHGFRSTFRDWAFEQSSFPREIAEAALAHVLGDKTEAAYRRGDALDKRRELMDAWAAFCGYASRREDRADG